jgi:cell division protein FtsA
MPREINKKEDIDLSQIDSQEEGMVSRYHVAEIIEARLEEIFMIINKEMKKIGKDKLLPAGVVLTGGTAKLPGCVDLAKNVLGLPSQAGFPEPLGGLVDKVDEPSFVTSVGLILWGAEDLNRKGSLIKNKLGSNMAGNMGEKVTHIKKWFGKFLP